MVKKDRHLPRRVRLGGGYIISILLLPPTQLSDLCDDEHEPERPYQGFWDMDKMTIFISTTLSAGERWQVYWHELIHAVNDIKDYDSDLRKASS